MSENLLNAIKNERRRNLGKRFNRWIEAQWGYERGFNKWRVSEERAVREITESILLDPNKCYFVYKDNKLVSLPDAACCFYAAVFNETPVDIDLLFTIHIDILVFKELLRDCRLKEILLY